MPYFDGAAIFGRSVRTVRSFNPRDEQRVIAPGVDGTAVLDMGQRGRVTNVEGLLVGLTASALNFNILFFESYLDGRSYVLTDSYANNWTYVKLTRFQPKSHPRFDAGRYGYIVPYEAVFQHKL